MILVSGASGFIGKNLMQHQRCGMVPFSLREANWTDKLSCLKPQKIIHLAGWAHAQGPKEMIYQINVETTKVLAEEAVRQGVKRFIFLSSIQAVTGKIAARAGRDFHPATCSNGTYAKSKHEAEEVLRNLAAKGDLEFVIIRPPLVYGPGVKGNFRILLELAGTGIPLPLSALDANQRSFLGISNLIDLILVCLDHSAAANRTFHASDDEDISTAELLRRMGKALKKPIRNLPMPEAILKTGLKLAGKGEWVDKLCGNLRVDISETKRLLGWKPQVTMEEELRRAVAWWRERKGSHD